MSTPDVKWARTFYGWCAQLGNRTLTVRRHRAWLVAQHTMKRTPTWVYQGRPTLDSSMPQCYVTVREAKDAAVEAARVLNQRELDNGAQSLYHKFTVEP